MTKIDVDQVCSFQNEGYGYDCCYGGVNVDSDKGFIVGVNSGFYLFEKGEERPHWLKEELEKEKNDYLCDLENRF